MTRIFIDMYRGQLSAIAVRFLQLCLVLLLSGCDAPALEPIPKDGTILAFGDSLTLGVGARLSSYPAVLADLTGLRVINAGVSGETTDAGLLRFEQLLASIRPNLLILMEGGNDILQKRDLAQTQANLASMIELAQAQQITVVLIGIPERLIFSSSAPLYKVLADKYKVVYEGKLIARLLHDSSLKSDHVHFNDAGYQVMAESIFNLLKTHGAVP